MKRYNFFKFAKDGDNVNQDVAKTEESDVLPVIELIPVTINSDSSDYRKTKIKSDNEIAPHFIKVAHAETKPKPN